MSQARPPTVAFVTDNGHGMGHLTRLFAVARRARGRFRPVFLTLSEGYPVLAEDGIPCEYLPSKDRLGVDQGAWVRALAPHLADGIRLLDARVVVVDHVAAPKLVRPMRPALGDRVLVWSRRGLWKPGRNLGNAAEGPEEFDSIVEPLDVTSPLDRGASAHHRDRVTAVPPVTLVHPSEYLDRDAARRALGLRPDSVAILMQVTGPDAARVERLIGSVVGVLDGRDGARRVELFAPIHVLDDGRVEPSRPVADGVTTVRRRVYPLARHLQAFDGVITTAGYNSFHEVLQSGVPGLFVPRDSDTLDDQPARARVPELIGAGLHAASLHDPDLDRKLRLLLDPVTAAGSRAASRVLFREDGAAAFADHVAGLVAPGRDDPGLGSAGLRPGRPTLGSALPGLAVVDAVGAGVGEVAELARILDEVVPPGRRVATVVAVAGGDGRDLRRVGVSQARFLGASEWAALARPGTHADYLRRRSETLRACLGAERSITVSSDDWPARLRAWRWE